MWPRDAAARVMSYANAAADAATVVLKKLTDIIVSFYSADLLAIMRENKPNAHFGLTIKPFDLFREMPEFSEFLAEEPIEALALLTRAVLEAQSSLVCADPDNASVPPLAVNSNVHARLGFMQHGVLEYNRANISAIRSSDAGLFLQVSGTVIRTGTVRGRVDCRHLFSRLLHDRVFIHTSALHVHYMRMCVRVCVRGGGGGGGWVGGCRLLWRGGWLWHRL